MICKIGAVAEGGGYALTLDWEMEKSVLILWEGNLKE